MSFFSGYDIIREISSTDKTSIYRCKRIDNNAPVILKVLNAKYPAQEDVAHLKHEFYLLKDLDLPGVIHAFGLEKTEHQYGLVMEDIQEGYPLKEVITGQEISIDMFLTLGIQLAQALHDLHLAHIIHKDVNPSNIIFSKKSNSVKLIDFSIATQLSNEVLETKSATDLEGTLAYMSPEQTSRMNRAVDERSDLYSLGVTFYEMLTGNLPFNAEDPLGWVHCHIAKKPTPPHRVRTDLPEVLSLIIMKLLAKTPEERYASAFGLKTDLERCLVSWRTKRKIQNFPLGEHDHKSAFHIPEKLYGREKEVQTLLQAFARASKGSREALFVLGNPGIGKSSLVNEVHKPIVHQRGYFSAGKCDQFKRIPYEVLIQAFRGLIRQILTENKQQIDFWREQLQNAIAPNGIVIAEVIPEIELLIGKQPPVPDLPFAETRNRFILVFFDLMRQFAKAEHPLVIYLDDLQWVDVATCNLLKDLLNDSALNHFLFIGSYRDNEVSADHPLMSLIEDIKKKEITVSNISLTPLSKKSVTQLIADTLNTENNIEFLAKLVYEKTGGNPFFIKFFLNNLYHDKYLLFDKKNGVWLWDIGKIQTLAITENMVDLIAKKIERLSKETQEILKLASLIGNQFDLETLSNVCKQSKIEIARKLWEPLQENLIFPMDESYKLAMVDSSYDKRKVNYKFSHDRVRDAAYGMMSSAEAEKLNLDLARTLLKSATPEDKDEKIFDIVNHYNASRNLLADINEKVNVAELSLQAGTKAKTYGAYASASSYFKYGIDLLSDKSWDEHYDLLFNLKLGYAECQYSLVKLQEADRLFEELVQQTSIPLDKARILLKQLLSYQMQAGYIKAVDIGYKGLKILGVNVPRHPSTLRVAFEAFSTWWRLRKQKPEDLLQLPILKDSKTKLIFDFITNMGPALYVTSQNLYSLLSFYSIKHILNSHISTGSNAYLTYAAFLTIQFQNYQLAHRYGQLAINLVDRFNEEQTAGATYASVYMLNSPWVLPYKECLEKLRYSYHKSRQVGDLVYANYSSGMLPLMMIIAGNHLADISNQIKISMGFAEYCNNIEILNTFKAWQSMLPYLRGEQSSKQFISNFWDFLNDKTTYAHEVGQAVHGIIFLIGLYLKRDWQSALQAYERTKKYINWPQLKALFCISDNYFFGSLILLNVYKEASYWKKLQYRREINQSLKKFKLWTTNCPENFEAKYKILLSGVAAYIHHDIEKANSYYQEATAFAQEHEQIHLIAIANELLGTYLASRNQMVSAKSYLQEAIYAYETWGAGSKVTELENEFPILAMSQKISKDPFTETIPKSAQMKQYLDLSTVIKSSQVISSRVKIEELLQTLIQIMLENAGAERGVVILLRNNELFVEAEGHVAKESRFILQHQPLETRKDISLAVIHYVQNTKESILLGDAAHASNFTEDPYIARNNILSILALPILQQGKLLGILYLENNLTTNAFSSERLQILQILASQIAISLENALLYNAYDQFIPHEFLELLSQRSIVDIRLGDHVQKYMTVLFSDIRNFTYLSEKMSPQEVFTFINEFLGYMEPIIKKHGGFIDKYIGDAIMALFPGEANDAVLTSIMMQKELENYNRTRLQRGDQAINIGIGINSGSLMLGTLGSGHRLETSVLSDAVNVAARIQNLTKEYGCQILVSEFVYEQLNKELRLESRFVDKIKMRGKALEVGIWEIYSGDTQKIRSIKNEIAENYNRGLALFFQNDYQKAAQEFQICLQRLPEDKVIKNYLHQCQNLQDPKLFDKNKKH